jgi:hypothetical protein
MAAGEPGDQPAGSAPDHSARDHHQQDSQEEGDPDRSQDSQSSLARSGGSSKARSFGGSATGSRRGGNRPDTVKAHLRFPQSCARLGECRDPWRAAARYERERSLIQLGCPPVQLLCPAASFCL